MLDKRSYCCKAEWQSRCFFVFSCIQVLKVWSFEKLGKAVLSYRNQKHDHQRKHNTGNWDPSETKTYEQINCLENRKHCNCLERNCFNKCSMVVFKNSAKKGINLETNNIRICKIMREAYGWMLLLVSSAWRGEEQ